MKFQDVFRFSFVIVSVVTLLFATSIVAQAASPRSGSGNFIQNFDKDGDGKVSKDEFTGWTRYSMPTTKTKTAISMRAKPRKVVHPAQ